MGVLLFRGGSREEQDVGLRATFHLGQTNQFAADSATLMGNSHRQIREVGTITEISGTTGNAHQQVAVSRRNDEIGVREHGGEAMALIHRAAVRQSRSPV